jgi:hypothetical protein
LNNIVPEFFKVFIIPRIWALKARNDQEVGREEPLYVGVARFNLHVTVALRNFVIQLLTKLCGAADKVSRGLKFFAQQNFIRVQCRAPHQWPVRRAATQRT